MSSLAWIGVALLGLCFGLGALLIRHIFADEAGASEEVGATARYGVTSAPAIALAISGIGIAGACLAPQSSIDRWLLALGLLGGAITAVALGLPALNFALARRGR